MIQFHPTGVGGGRIAAGAGELEQRRSAAYSDADLGSDRSDRTSVEPITSLPLRFRGSSVGLRAAGRGGDLYVFLRVTIFFIAALFFCIAALTISF